MFTRTAPPRLESRLPRNIQQNSKFGAGAPPNPYFFVQGAAEGGFTKGQSTCFLGHEIPRGGGGKSDGIYAAWAWDGKRLQVRNDRYGLFPLYYFCHGNAFGISPSIAELVALGAPTELDYPALAVFLQLQSFLGEDTPFRAIRAVPPGADFSWENGQLRLSSERPASQANRIARSDALSGYIELFAAAMRRRSPPGEDFAVPLSGGRDSRHILLELCAMVRRPQFAATVQWSDLSPGDDVDIATRFTDELGLPHVVLDQRPWSFEAALRTVRETGFCSGDEHTWAFVLADYLAGRASVIYDGIGGDVWSAGHFITDTRLELFAAGKFEELATEVMPPFSLRMVLDPEGRPLKDDAGRERLIAELRKHADAPNPVGSFFFWNRTRRYVALSPHRVLSGCRTVFCPYLDHELYDFLTALPAEVVRDHTFHTEAIQKAYPKWAGIPFGHGSGKHRSQETRFLSTFTRRVVRFCAANLAPDLVDSRYVIPRLLRLLADPQYAQSIEWFGPIMLYLLRLDRFRKDGRV
jgi:asparagine synthase (glutamine-hydrolysing)